MHDRVATTVMLWAVLPLAFLHSRSVRLPDSA